MQTIRSILADLDERTVARRIGIPHDEARMAYPLGANTVSSFDEFRNLIADYCNYHITRCVSRGGHLTGGQAYGKAKELLEQEYRKRNGDIVSAFNDAQDGTNGGMRVVLDTIAEGLKAEATERYVSDLFDRYIAPNSWEQKVEIIRQFITYCGHVLADAVARSQPERYAHDYSDLIQSYVEGLKRTSAMFRRL